MTEPAAHERATRREHDSIGAIDVPAAALWGAQTQRALLHFAIGNERMPLPWVHALALCKGAAARINQRLSYASAAQAPTRGAAASA